MRWSNSGRAIVANVVGHLADTVGGFGAREVGHRLTIVRSEASGTAVDLADPADRNGAGIYRLTTTSMANWIAQQGYSY